MFAKRRKTREARREALLLRTLQNEVDSIYLGAMIDAVQEHPEWAPQACIMLYS